MYRAPCLAVVFTFVIGLTYMGHATAEEIPRSRAKAKVTETKKAQRTARSRRARTQENTKTLTPTQCGKKVDDLLDFMMHLSRPNHVGVSHIWKCKRDPNSPTGKENKPGECKETVFTALSNGGIGHLNNKGDALRLKAKAAMLRGEQNKANDAKRRIPLDLWYKWERVLNRGQKHYFTGRFCTHINKDGHPVATTYLKNSTTINRKNGETILPVKRYMPALAKMADLYRDEKNRLSNWLGFTVGFDEQTCKVKMGSYTGLLSRRNKRHRFNGGKPVGGRFAFFEELAFNPDSKKNGFLFEGKWRRSLVTDNFKPMIRNTMLAWVKEQIGAAPTINWRNWDLQVRLEMTLIPTDSSQKYEINVDRYYCLYRHKKVASDIKPNGKARHFKVGECTGIGMVPHGDHKIYLYDSTKGAHAKNTSTNKRIKKEIAKTVVGLKNSCPWAMKTPELMVKRFEQFARDDAKGKFTVPGKNRTYPASGAFKKSPLKGD